MTTDGKSIYMDPKAEIRYNKSTKKEYLSKLGKLFDNTTKIDVRFDNISISRNGAKPYVYGVTLKQDWITSDYCDTGWVFLLWDFYDRDKPVIHVRTWQPELDDFGENDVFNMGDFVIP